MEIKNHLYGTALDNIGGTRSLSMQKTSNLAFLAIKNMHNLTNFRVWPPPRVLHNQKIKRIINSSDKLLLDSSRLANCKFSLLFHKKNSQILFCITMTIVFYCVNYNLLIKTQLPQPPKIFPEQRKRNKRSHDL